MKSVDNKRPLKVFLCHAHADRDAVRGLYTRLTKDGVDAWLDKEKLLPGQDWELEIRKAVREADVVVVCLSKQFNQRGFRQKEVRLALDTAMEQPEGEIFIIPTRLEECETLESLRKWHWVDLFEKDGYAKLMQALLARANSSDVTLQQLPVEISFHANGEIVPESKKVTEIAKDENRSALSKGKAFFRKILTPLLDLKVLGFAVALIVLLFGNNFYAQLT
jgi:TIR domain